jgi:hypothetical protein
MLDINNVLGNIKEVAISRENEAKIRNGNIIDKFFDGDIVKVVNEDGELIAIYQTYDKDNSKARPYKMFI